MADLPKSYGSPRKQLMVLGVLAAGMTALGAGLAVGAGPVGWVTGLPAALFFGACTVVIFVRAMTPTPVLILDAQAVLPWRFPPLAWDDLDFAEVATSNNEAFLILHAKDHDGYLSRFPFFKRKWAQINARLLPGSVYLSVRMFDEDAADIASTINAELARRRGANTRW